MTGYTHRLVLHTRSLRHTRILRFTGLILVGLRLHSHVVHAPPHAFTRCYRWLHTFVTLRLLHTQDAVWIHTHARFVAVLHGSGLSSTTLGWIPTATTPVQLHCIHIWVTLVYLHGCGCIPLPFYAALPCAFTTRCTVDATTSHTFLPGFGSLLPYTTVGCHG